MNNLLTEEEFETIKYFKKTIDDFNFEIERLYGNSSTGRLYLKYFVFNQSEICEGLYDKLTKKSDRDLFYEFNNFLKLSKFDVNNIFYKFEIFRDDKNNNILGVENINDLKKLTIKLHNINNLMELRSEVASQDNFYIKKNHKRRNKSLETQSNDLKLLFEQLTAIIEDYKKDKDNGKTKEVLITYLEKINKEVISKDSIEFNKLYIDDLTDFLIALSNIDSSRKDLNGIDNLTKSKNKFFDMSYFKRKRITEYIDDVRAKIEEQRKTLLANPNQIGDVQKNCLKIISEVIKHNAINQHTDVTTSIGSFIVSCFKKIRKKFEEKVLLPKSPSSIDDSFGIKSEFRKKVERISKNFESQISKPLLV